MKRILKIMICLTAMTVMLPSTTMAQKKEKQKKEKKEWKWTMPSRMTGDEDFDLYLRTCDTLNTRITTYVDSVTFYSVKQIRLTDSEGNIVKNAAGEDSIIVAVVDENNNIRSRKLAWAQTVRMFTTGGAILSDMVNITLLEATAATSLATNPLLAFTHGKYLKAGPKLVQYGGQTIKELMRRLKTQKAQIRSYKENYTESGVAKDPTVDPAAIGLPDMEIVDKTQADAERQLLAAIAEDSNLEEVPDGEDFDLDSLAML